MGKTRREKNGKIGRKIQGKCLGIERLNPEGISGILEGKNGGK